MSFHSSNLGVKKSNLDIEKHPKNILQFSHKIQNNFEHLIFIFKGEWHMLEKMKQEICEIVMGISDLDLLDLILKLLLNESR